MNLRIADVRALKSKAAEAETLLKALANEHRLTILCELHLGERSVSELQQTMGLGQSALSQHLARLRADRLVTTRREAQMIHYSIGSHQVAEVISLLHHLFCGPACRKSPAKRGRKRPASTARRRAAHG
jgi:DNA-binding transcriptional ArsR family regulator